MIGAAVLLAAAVAGSSAKAAAPAGSGTNLADTPASSTISLFSSFSATSIVPSLSKVDVRRVTLKGIQKTSISIPDGVGRIQVGTEIGPSSFRMGSYYNFFTGRIEASMTYGVALLKDGPELQIGASDAVGLGRLYLRDRYFERARSLPIGIGDTTRFGSFIVNAQRTTWRLASLDTPNTEEAGIIDSWGLEWTSTGVLPDLVEILRQQPARRDHNTFRYRRAFRGLGGNWRFDRADMDIRSWTKGIRREDEIMLRVFLGQTWGIRPSLPLRETYALGGADALKGYGYEEFRGPGVALFGTEYALKLPFSFKIGGVRLQIDRWDVVTFVESGRIQDKWFTGTTPFKWSGGAGFKFSGRMLGGPKSVFRLYAAQAMEWRTRTPIFYAMADIG